MTFDRTEVADGIRASAEALGMPPEWLGTIISYETAGTFDPKKKGPTTQYGQHKGLIQFGEPQAMQYGVDWEDPVRSQLGPDGAVVKYFTERGWRPGMSFLDAYSIVNAGGPGRYSASDASNGGASGSVYDKVTTQMDGHFSKARSLLSIGDPDMDPAKRNAYISALMTRKSAEDEVSASQSVEASRAPESTMSSAREDERPARRSPYLEALGLSYNQIKQSPLSDPNRDGAVQQVFARR